ncbi:MAG TPA: asparaginase [Alphaproteobacteria bacterium]|nr:asparaginase [Alphaproteobacteria bacterium]
MRPSPSETIRVQVEANPVLVTIVRGAAIESRHRGAAAVVDAHGKIVHAWGDVEQAVFPRSAIKPLQAIAVIETGAADAFGLSDAELALTCASHSGEPKHADMVKSWLERIGLGVEHLECGAHPPYYAPAHEAMIRDGRKPTAAHNNCSGKHSGMLSASRHMGEATKGYIKLDHPAQRRWMKTVGELCGVDLGRAPMGIDGCSIPTVAIPIVAMARGMARLASQAGLHAERVAAARRVVAAATGHPDLVAGTGRFNTVVMEGLSGRVLLKGGAEGVYCAAIPSLGFGIALKIDDGAGRAAEVATAAILRHVGAIDDTNWTALADACRPKISNWNHFEVGEIRAANGWLAG